MTNLTIKGTIDHLFLSIKDLLLSRNMIIITDHTIHQFSKEKAMITSIKTNMIQIPNAQTIKLINTNPKMILDLAIIQKTTNTEVMIDFLQLLKRIK